MADRGVYEVPFPDPDGGRLIYCVDRHGIRRREMTIHEGERSVGMGLLWRYLDKVDPAPQRRPRLKVLDMDPKGGDR